ncbi:hypothetical protein OAZ15_04830 [Pelagibacteraceae bacterium]|nr:hypothetical protein [Pelagibacteraceae bacterium]
MKIDPLNILLNKDVELNKNYYFISGNEKTLIEKITKTIILKYQKNGGYDLTRIDSIKNFVDEKSLFETKKIVLTNNCKDLDEDAINKTKETKNVFVFVGENSQKIKKIKSFFINDNDSYLIDCYELDKSSKIKILNNFIEKSKIKIEQDVYWFLIERLDNRYMFLENSLNKISEIDQKDISLINIKKILVSNDSGKEKVFFNLLKKNKIIVEIYREKITTLSDVNEFYYYCKFFCQLIIDCNNLEEFRKKIPIYLFKEKVFLINMYKQYNYKKKKLLLKLLSSTEKTLRTESNLSLASGLRFLLGIKRITIS